MIPSRLIRLLLPAVLLAFATSTPGQETSRYAGDPLLLGAGARAQGMGNAYVAVSDDATAVYWNPAGLTKLAGRELQLQHAEQFGGTVNHDVLTLALPYKSTTLGLGLVRLGVAGITRTELEDPTLPAGPDNRPVGTRTVGVSEYNLYLSGGREIREHLSVGASVKLLWRNLSAGNGSGYGLDLSTVYSPRPDLSVGLTLRNLTGTTIAFDSGTKDRIPPSILAGAAYTHEVPSLHGRATVSASVHLGEEKSGVEDAQGVHLGVEFMYRGRAAFRLGAEGDHFTAGAGVRVSDRFGLDLAFLENSQLDNSYRISASAYF